MTRSASRPLGERFTRDCGAADAIKNMCWREMKSRCAGSICGNCLAIWGSLTSVRFGARKFDDVRPLVGLLADELSEVSRRAANHRTAELGEPDPHRRIAESRIYLFVE